MTVSATAKPPNQALQSDERRAWIAGDCNVALAPLAAERQNRYAETLD